MKTVSLLGALLFPALMSSMAGETFYLGTYTAPGKSRGIYRYELEPETGAVRALGLAVETESPSFLALHPGGKFLYAVNEVSKGTVSAFALEADGSLRPLNKQPSRGGGPTHISLDHAGRNALVANYNSGSVAVLPIHDDGTLGEVTGFVQNTGSGPNRERQQGPHAHSIYVSGDDKAVFSCDLGLDRVFQYEFDPATGMLGIPGKWPFFSAKPGAGPRHLALEPGEKHIYLVSEISSTVSVWERGKDGAYTETQELSTLPAGYKSESTAAEIMLHPNGRFLYVTNRGHESVAAFSVDREDGKLTALAQTPTQGQGPRFFTIDPSGKYLLVANQTTKNVVVFHLDPETGALTPAGHSLEQDQPVCIVFTGK